MIALIVAIIAASIWVIVALATGIGLGRVIARAESEEGTRLPSTGGPLRRPARL
ncbi:hypothetical protein AB1K56_10835 [Microbacterium sp. BWR-S6Y]|uniref:hypothetical protein n=1 Tax=Microbacterium TaxID=33882 RepID=UPI00142E5785|nr:hypothetical protein [Microbacterium hydrothermale]